MADSNSASSGNFPWATVAMLAAFVTSTQLVPHAFEALRPAEKDRVQATLEAELPIDARLWEDPFTALRRFEAERKERCSKDGKALNDCAASASDKANASSLTLPPHILRRFGPVPGGKPKEDALVLMALVPGNPFVGAEESRRRSRYAILSGLQATGYVPDDAEHMGLLSFSRAQLQTTAAGATGDSSFNVPYEFLSYAPAPELRHMRPKLKRFKRVLLLWVNESALPQPKLDALALMTMQLYSAWAGCGQAQSATPAASAVSTASGVPSLAVIGPSSTDALRVALADLDHASETANKYNKDGRGAAAECREKFKAAAGIRDALNGAAPANDLQLGYWQLAHTRFFSAASTAPAKFLPELGQALEVKDFLDQQFGEILKGPFTWPLGKDEKTALAFERKIAPDTAVLKLLLDELHIRLPADQLRRVVLITERDSLYAQSLLREMSARLDPEHPLKRSMLQPETAYYFRGIDGVTTRDALTSNGGGAGERKVGKDGEDAARNIEWPEARDQLDYLRRLAQTLQQSEADPQAVPIGAIGVLGSDVHDKLLVMQALHETFADRIFFTTDMDARLLHPRALPFTRNLIVASSLPLRMPRPKREAGQDEPLDLRAGGAPFRDVYQSATYLAAREASCSDQACVQAEHDAAQGLIDKPRLYEVGLTRPVVLSSEVQAITVGRAIKGQGLVAGMLMGLVVLALLLWPRTPSLRALRAGLVWPPAGAEPLQRPNGYALFIATGHLLLLGYSAASVLEFLNPHSVGMGLLVLLSAAALLPAVLAYWPALRRGKRLSSAQFDGLILALALGLAWLLWRHQGEGMCHDCEPIAWFEGVSAWPSHLLHLLALVFLVVSIDLAWQQGMQSLQADAQWLGMPCKSEAAPEGSLRAWLAYLPQISVLRWQRAPGYSCDMNQLWQDYQSRGQGLPRLLRTALSVALTAALGIGLFWVLGTGQAGWGDSRLFEIPVRGEVHRTVVFSAFAGIVLLLPVAILSVADAILLAYRFVTHLNTGRSVYPQACLQRFANALGDEKRAALWCQRMACEPQDRLSAPGVGPHTLLDDWIDMQLVARRTEHIAPLVMGPFIVMGILLLARSHLFDNWSMTPLVAIVASVYLLILIVLSALLKHAVERTRSHALAHMAADLRWLSGLGGPQAELAKPFEALMDEVRQMRSGSFAGFFDQPLLKAMLLPLGGAGGAQLLDYVGLLN